MSSLLSGPPFGPPNARRLQSRSSSPLAATRWEMGSYQAWRPGGNLTGFSYMSTDLAAKRLELLSEAFSRNKRFGALYNPGEPATKREMESTLAAGRSIGVTVIPIAAQDVAQLEGAFQAAVAENTDGLIVFTHGFAVLSRGRIIELAASRRLPVMYGWRDLSMRVGSCPTALISKCLFDGRLSMWIASSKELIKATFRSSSARGYSWS